MRQAAQEAIEDGLNSYTRYDGIGELRSAIACKIENRYGVKVDPDKEVIVTAGATGRSTALASPS